MSDTGGIATATVDGFTVTSNTETAEEIRANLESEPKPLDGDDKDAARVKDKAEKKERSEAASKLGKAGGEAAAKAKAEKVEPEKEAKAETEPEKEHSRAKVRIEQLAREKNEERSKRQELEARLAKLEGEHKPEAKPAETKPSGDEKPVLSNYEIYEDWVEAVADWKADRKLQDRDKKFEEQSKAEANRKQIATFFQRVDEAIRASPDLAEKVILDVTSMKPASLLRPGEPQQPGNDIMQAIIESENAVPLLTYLGAHPEELERLKQLPGTFQVYRAMGMLEAGLTGTKPPTPAETTAQVEAVSQAKPPVRPVASSAQVGEEDPEDFDEYVRVANARDARAGRRR